MKPPILALACLTALGVGAFGVLKPGFESNPARLDNRIETSSIDEPRERLAAGETFTTLEPAPDVQLAQTATPATGQRQEAQPQPQQQRVSVDESALRYFASKGDTARLNAEIARLRSLYPDWVPPENPLAVPQNEDRELERMWQLYSEGRYADVRKAIADRQAADAGWTPPADLIDRLDIVERRARLIAASDAANNAEVVDIAAQAPSLLTCSDVDVLWRVAEAFVRTDRRPRARDAYAYILKNCANEPERIATVQKAAPLLTYQEMQDLIALEKTRADGTLEFEPIRDDLARRFVAEAEMDKALTIAMPYLQRLERLVETKSLAADALLLGWYHLRREDMPAAERWFRKAREIEDTASASQGLALTLIARKDPREAENIMHRWYDSSDEAKSTYLAATANLLALEPAVELEGQVLARIAAVTLKEKDPATAQQFGWYALAFRQPKTAEQWFNTALGWKSDDEPSAYGLAVSRLQLEDAAGVAEVQKAWSGRSERIARLGETQEQDEPVARPRTAIVEERPVARTQRQQRPQSQETIVVQQRAATSGSGPRRAGCRTTVDPETQDPSTALGLGWCLMDLNRPLEAAGAFKVALKSSSPQTRQEAAYGQSLAYLRAGLVNQAAVSAAKTPLTRERTSELQSAILSDRAVAAFDAGRYREALLFLDQLAQLRTERTDLMVLRGYAYKNLNRRADARRLFEAVAATGNRDAIRALGDLNAEDMRKK